MRAPLTRIGALVRKEFLHLARDPRALAIVVLLPMLQLLLFAWAISFDVRDVATVVWDADRTPASRAYVEQYSAGGFFRVVGAVDSQASLDDSFERDIARVALVVPAGFQQLQDAGDRAPVQVLVDGSQTTSARMGEAYSLALNQRYNATSYATWVARTPGAGPSDVVAPGVLSPAVRTWYNPDRLSSVFLIPGLIVVILMIVAVQQTSVTIVRERDQHTAEQMLVSPLRNTELVIGKLLPWTLLAFGIMAAVTGLGMWLFELPLRGSVPLLVVTSIVFVFACLAIGVIISSVTPSPETANITAIMVAVLPSFLLSGFAFPLEAMPVALQAFTYLFPAREMVSISRAVFLKGAGFADVLVDLGLLLGYAVVAVALAVHLYARRARR